MTGAEHMHIVLWISCSLDEDTVFRSYHLEIQARYREHVTTNSYGELFSTGAYNVRRIVAIVDGRLCMGCAKWTVTRYWVKYVIGYYY